MLKHNALYSSFKRLQIHYILITPKIITNKLAYITHLKKPSKKLLKLRKISLPVNNNGKTATYKIMASRDIFSTSL